MQQVQKLKGRQSAEEEGEGHCAPVICIAASTQHSLVASCALEPDSTIRLWQDPAAA